MCMLDDIQTDEPQSTQCLTIQIVYFEEELDLIVGALPRELVHRIEELRQADGAAAVAVEDLEDALREERLQGGMGGEN